MNIFEIVSLNENVERVPGQNMWRIIYPEEMGRTPDIMPTQEKAQAKYDQEVERWRSSSAERQRQERDANRQRARNQRERDKEAARRAKQDTQTSQARRETRQRWTRQFARIRTIGGAGGFVIVSTQMWETAMDQMMRNYRSYANGAYGDISLNDQGEPNNPLEAGLARQAYELAQARFLGAWCATVVAPQVYFGIRAIVALGVAGVRRFVRLIRGANVASTVASAAAGPPGIVLGIIKFILVEGFMWAAIGLLLNNQAAQRSLANWIATSYFGNLLADRATNILQLEANIAADILEYISDAANWDTEELQGTLRNMEELSGLSDDEAKRRVLQTDATQGGQTPHGEFRGIDNPDAVSPSTTSGSNPLRTPGMN